MIFTNMCLERQIKHFFMEFSLIDNKNICTYQIIFENIKKIVPNLHNVTGVNIKPYISKWNISIV